MPAGSKQTLTYSTDFGNLFTHLQHPGDWGRFVEPHGGGSSGGMEMGVGSVGHGGVMVGVVVQVPAVPTKGRRTHETEREQSSEADR